MNNTSILLEKLHQIEEILSKTKPRGEHIGVLAGASGRALFHFYYAKFMQTEANADMGAEILSSIIEQINEGYTYPTFCTGIAGAAWTIELLREEEMVDIDSDELLSGLDEFLVQSVEQFGKEDNYYDFLHGVMGIGFYFLKRYQNTASDILKKSYKKILLEIISTLDATAIKKGDTAKWEVYLIKEEKLKGYNLSLSHGMMSIINFLSRLAAYKEFYPEVEKLMKDAIHYVLGFEDASISSSSLFPSWVYDGMKVDSSARLGWCYGDLGIGITLWRAGKVLNDDRIEQKGIEILKHSANRRDLTECKIKDSGLCHGAFGVMHVYQYMYKETKEELFKETSDFWMREGLTMAIHQNGQAGYMQWSGGENEGWRNETNLLEGITGIGLAIISYLAPFDTKWDECLLIS